MSGENCSMKNHTLFRQDCDINNGDLSSGYRFTKMHTISQREYASTFNNMDGYVENGDVSSGYGYMNRHTYFKQNGFKLLMSFNDRDDTYMNDNLQNGYVSSGIGSLNIHTLPQYNKSSNLNEMNVGVENGDVNGGNYL